MPPEAPYPPNTMTVSLAANAPMYNLSTVAVVIPALNEADNLRILMPRFVGMNLGQIVVGDNGSTDATADVAREFGATVANVTDRGYGAACHAALQQLNDDIETIIFVNADLTDDVTLIPAMIAPIHGNECDVVIGIRVPPLRGQGSMSIPQQFGDKLAVLLIRLAWDVDYYDLGPYRAISRKALDQIDMQDRAYGWTIELQIRAIQENLRVQQLPVPYHRSPTPSRIGGTVRGVLRAGWCILSTWWRLWRNAPGDEA